MCRSNVRHIFWRWWKLSGQGFGVFIFTAGQLTLRHAGRALYWSLSPPCWNNYRGIVSGWYREWIFITVVEGCTALMHGRIKIPVGGDAALQLSTAFASRFDNCRSAVELTSKRTLFEFRGLLQIIFAFFWIIQSIRLLMNAAHSPGTIVETYENCSCSWLHRSFNGDYVSLPNQSWEQ